MSWRSLARERELWLLVAIAIVARVAVGLAVGPHTSADSELYLRLAERLGRLDLKGDDGARTPGYPLLLLLLGSAPAAIVAVQAALGVATGALLYRLVRPLSTPRTALVAALLPTLDPGALLFETTVLTEALAGFLVVLGVTIASDAARDPGPARGRLLAVSTVGAVAALTRPALQVLPVLLVIAVVIARRRQGAPRARDGLVAMLPYAALVGGWSALNLARFRWFTLSTLLGFNLVQHAAGFVELARPDDRVLADAIVHGREAKGAAIGAVWRAIPEMEASTGLSQVDLSHRLVGTCVDLFVHHPLRYAASVAKAAVLFWFPAPYYDGFSLGAYFHGAEPLIVYVYSALYLAVVAGFVLGVPWRLARRSPFTRTPETALVLVTVLSTWAITSLTEVGENARYKMPVQALVLAWGVLAALGRPRRSD